MKGRKNLLGKSVPPAASSLQSIPSFSSVSRRPRPRYRRVTPQRLALCLIRSLRSSQPSTCSGRRRGACAGRWGRGATRISLGVPPIAFVSPPSEPQASWQTKKGMQNRYLTTFIGARIFWVRLAVGVRIRPGSQGQLVSGEGLSFVLREVSRRSRIPPACPSGSDDMGHGSHRPLFLYKNYTFALSNSRQRVKVSNLIA